MLPLRIYSNLVRPCQINAFNILRCLTTTPQNLNATSKFLVENKKDFVILKMNKAPVNSLDLDTLKEFNAVMDSLNSNDHLKGIILTSDVKNVFSSGLDLNEMYKCNTDRLKEFWKLMQSLWIGLYGSNKVVIAAINGHSPAAGCQLAMSCDYRIMVKGPYKIGISAALLGIKTPFWFRDTMVNTIGYRETEKALQTGKLFSPEEALRIRLVDELAENQEDLMVKAEAELRKWIKIPTEARQLTKVSMRRETLQKLTSQLQFDVENFVDSTTKEHIQNSLKKYLEGLKAKKPNKEASQ